MNDKSYARVMAAKTHHLASELQWVSMWHHAEDGDYELAMTCQLLYLVNRDEWLDWLDAFSKSDWKAYTEMHQCLTKGHC